MSPRRKRAPKELLLPGAHRARDGGAARRPHGEHALHVRPEQGRLPLANILPLGTRVLIAGMLSEANSLRGTARVAKVTKNAVMAFALKLGDGCAQLHNRLIRDLAAYFIEADETWSFIHTKEARVKPDRDPVEWGDVYTFIAIDAATKLVISYLAGKRDGQSTDAFVKDLRSRITVVPHFTTDGWQPYISAVATHFPGVIDYGQCVKRYGTGASRGPDHRYEPPRDPFITKTAIAGSPDVDRLSTSYVERYNLTQRHIVGRTRRLCLAFSKTMRGHETGVAFGVCVYNFVRKHDALGETPAMAAGLTDHQWSMHELVMAALAEVPVELPIAVPLKFPPGRATGPVRELPNGRGFLRVVGGPGAPGSDPASPDPADPVLPAMVEARGEPIGEDPQLKLFLWKPPPPPPPTKRIASEQLGLFGIDLEPAPKR